MKFAIIGIIIIIAAIGGLLIFSGGGTENSQENNESTSSGKDKAPSFSLKDYDGSEVALADFTGKNIIVNSWAVWCPFCVKELKDFAELERELGDSITIIAIDRAESLEKQKSYTDDLSKIIYIIQYQDALPPRKTKSPI